MTATSKVKSATRSERMRAKWADPAYAATMTAKREAGRAAAIERRRAAKITKPSDPPPAPPTPADPPAPPPTPPGDRDPKVKAGTSRRYLRGRFRTRKPASA